MLKPLQIVFWPATVDAALMAKTVAQALQNPKDELVIVASYFNLSMTAIMESSLSKIASGELTLDAFMRWQKDWFGKLIEAIKSQTIDIGSNIQTVECPDCGKDMFLRKGKKGQFWGCSGYPDCKTVAQNNSGKVVFEKDMPDCPKYGKKLRRIKGKKGWFWSCKGYFDEPKCEFSIGDKASKPDFVS